MFTRRCELRIGMRMADTLFSPESARLRFVVAGYLFCRSFAPDPLSFSLRGASGSVRSSLTFLLSESCLATKLTCAQQLDHQRNLPERFRLVATVSRPILSVRPVTFSHLGLLLASVSTRQWTCVGCRLSSFGGIVAARR